MADTIANVRWMWLLIVLAGCRQIFGISDPAALADAPSTVHFDAPPPDTLPGGPIVHFAFDALSNDLTLDSSGHHHDAACSNPSCPTPVAGELGNALKFGSSSGTAKNLTVAASTEFAFTHGFTVAFWIELTQLPMLQGCPLTQEGVFWICVASTGAITYLAMTTGAGTLESTALLQMGKFEHVAVTYDGARATIYINGAADQSTGEPMPAMGNSSLVLGTDIETGSVLPATLDELEIWTRPLSASEIAILGGP